MPMSAVNVSHNKFLPLNIMVFFIGRYWSSVRASYDHLDLSIKLMILYVYFCFVLICDYYDIKLNVRY